MKSALRRMAMLCGLAASLIADSGCAKKVGEDSLAVVFATGDKAHLSAIRFLPDGKHVVTASDDRLIRLWDWAAARQEQVVDNGRPVNSLAIGLEGSTLLSGNGDGTLSLWDLRTWSLITRWQAHSGAVHGVDISPDGLLAASGSDDSTVKIWELPSGRLLRVLLGHTGWVGQVHFSPDGTLLLSASADSTLRLWDVKTGSTEHVLAGHSAWVRSAVFVARGDKILSGGYDQDLRLWDTRTGKLLRMIHGKSIIHEVNASRDGLWGMSVDWNSSLTLWDLTRGARAHSYSTPWRGFRNSTSCGDLSADGRWAVAGDWDDNVYVWDLRPEETASR